VLCADVAPQQDQSSISWVSMPRAWLTASMDWLYSFAVP
jgi:hypothetical protein